MADDAMTDGWDKAEKAITKGKGESALKILRAIDADGKEPTTLRLAGHATWLEAKARNNRGDYRRAASLLRESTKKNPRDKKADRLYNDLLNEMQDKGISETTFPRLLNDGTPTPAGIVAIFMAGVLVLAMINVVNRADTTTDIVDLQLRWNGGANSGTVTIELYPDSAPIHVENFKLLVQNGDYDGTVFHRVIDDFMIQGGDFTDGNGQGGHAAKWFGYCDGDNGVSEADCQQDRYTIPDEADNGLDHEPCTISMAKTSAPHTGGSQFFLIPSDSTPTWLDGVHTVFGEVTSGCNHVTAISGVETESNDRPVQNVELVSATFVGSETKPWYEFW
ncbi:MAG: peptidylprolyl isomerase [Candidatus Thermoplasmatota archaeon]|nr:peptidylprolyl isomerase [Candidatus Thermoplasmatota archaeon]